MNIDCQIRGKADIHEALSTMCEVEVMEGANKVFCDRCKKNCDTVLRTAISNLPDVLVLSLKRFDLDFNTFETVKLNSRCAFGQTLNMKRYTLDGLEEMENTGADVGEGEDDDVVMKPVEEVVIKSDEDYEYNLAGVLVHAGVAQGGHYYSFIKDRSSQGENGTWYRFDDEDVTIFDPASIELECFGGKVKQEKKFLNGQTQTVESEQFANALMLFYEKVKPNEIEDDNDQKNNEKDKAIYETKDKIKMSSGYDVFQPDVQRSNKAHSWHSFLFDSEFQSFFKGLLGLSRIPTEIETNNVGSMEMAVTSPFPDVNDKGLNWRSTVLQMSLTYFCEVLVHSADNNTLRDWVKKLSEALQFDPSAGQWFVHELARRTHCINKNWLRIFCADCPEEPSRNAAVNTISAAISSCIRYLNEQSALQSWVNALERSDQGDKYQLSSHEHEDLDGLKNNSSSSIGIVISHIALLLEHAPRTWRYNNELCLLIRNISNISSKDGGDLVRRALVAAQIPARLICLAIREKAPNMLKTAFPGASVSHAVAEALVRNETPTSSHLLNLDAGAVSMGTSTNHSGNSVTLPSPSDHMFLFESLSCLIGVPGGKPTNLVEDSDEFSKSKSSLMLSQSAREALSIIFNESKTSDAGMGQRDIEKYMLRCGMDSNNVHPHKIASILNKYSTVTAPGIESSKMARYLTVEGFLTYYRDTVQSNEAQVRMQRVQHTHWYSNLVI